MIKVLSFLFLIYGVSSFGQGLHWLHSFGDVSSDQPVEVIIDDENNLYVSGGFHGDIDLDPSEDEAILSSGATGDAFVAKYGRDGSLTWFIQFESVTNYVEVHDIAIDGEGALLIFGDYLGPMRVVPAVGEEFVETAGSRTEFLSKFNADGSYVSFDEFNLDFEKGFELDADNNRYFYGYFEDTYHLYPGEPEAELTAAVRDGYVLKLNADNEFVWIKQFESSESSHIRHLKINSENEVVIVGVFRSDVDSDPSAETNIFTTISSNIDIFVTKLNQDGEYIWSGQVKGFGPEEPIGMCLDEMDNIYMCGSFYNSSDFDPSMEEYIMSGGGTSGFLCKWNSDGEFVWGQNFTRDFAASHYSQLTTHDGLLYISGVLIGGTYDFNPDPEEEEIMVTTGAVDCFVQVLNEEGEFVNLFQMGGTTYVKTSSMVVDDLENLYVLGNFNHSINFDDDLGMAESAGETDIFLVKYGHSFTSLFAESTKSFKVFPNPSNGTFLVDTDEDAFVVEIYSLDGKLIHQEASSIGQKQFTLDLNRGAYILQISSSANVQKEILIIN